MKLYIIVQRCYYGCNPKGRYNKMRDFILTLKNCIHIVIKTFSRLLKILKHGFFKILHFSPEIQISALYFMKLISNKNVFGSKILTQI